MKTTRMKKGILISVCICFFVTVSAKRGFVSGNRVGIPNNDPVPITRVSSVSMLLKSLTATKAILGFTQTGRQVEAYFFPGKSEKRALVIAGVHGSELSSIEVAERLIEQLQKGNQPYYSVIIIPSLFPDNAAVARNNPQYIGSTYNHGRYSSDTSADPNRQMPSLGKPYDATCRDHLGRKIETENCLLLDLINEYRPQRIVNIHAIRDTTKAGIYADPRTDANGIALGYATDSSLAITMARYIFNNDGYIPGNHIDSNVTSLYHCDPPAAEAGFMQQRNLRGSALPNQRGQGVSLGAWVSTAVCDEANPQNNRDAVRILTMEFPGYKRSSDYGTACEQTKMEKSVQLYAASVQAIFLEKYFEE